MLLPPSANLLTKGHIKYGVSGIRVRVRYRVVLVFRVSINIRFFVLYFIHLYSVDGTTESFDRRENGAYALSLTTVVRIAPAYSYSPCVASPAGIPPGGLGLSGLVHEKVHACIP